MIKFQLEGDYIPLISLLKANALVQSGGEAQVVVEQGLIKVNGETEFRKRAKIYRGDKVEFLNHTILIN